MHRHRWKILIGIALVFVVLTGIEVMTIGNGPKKKVEAYKKSLIARGEKLKISELVPPPVAPEQNGADVVDQALGMLTPEDQYSYSNSIPAMRMIAPGKAIVCYEQPDVRNANFTNSWANELAVAADDQPMNELLKQAINYPAIDFELNYEDLPDMEHYRLFTAAQSLSTEATCDLHQGNTAAAGTNISTILAIVKGLDGERFEDFQYLRIIMAWLAANTTWELLQSSNVDDADLARLQKNWEGPEFIHAMENAVSMQRAKIESEILKMRASKEYFNKETQGAWDEVDWSESWGDAFDALLNNAKVASARSMYQASWTYSDELAMLKENEILLQTLRTAETNGAFYPAYYIMTKELGVYESGGPNNWLTRLDNYDLRRMFSIEAFQERTVSRTLEAEATRRIVITAITLKRYQLKHGSYPSSLADLVPEFISSTPRDPVDGKPLRYRRTVDGTFLLYSIGENGRDDGGNGSVTRRTGGHFSFGWTDPNALDWVWPQPATPAEVDAFYAHPAGP